MTRHMVKVSPQRRLSGCGSWIVVCAAIAMPSGACAQAKDAVDTSSTEVTVAAEPAPTGQHAAAVSVGELSERPQQFHGRTVTVRGEVEEIISPNLFTLDEDNIVSAGRDVLVFVARPEAVPEEGKTVAVTGPVRPFVRADFIRDFDWFYPDPDLFVRFSSRPVVLATSGRLESGMDLVREPRHSTGSELVGTAGSLPSRASDSGYIETSAGDLADEPQRFFGRRVRVRGEVEQIFGPRLFTLDEDTFFSTGRDVLVLMPEGEAVPIDGSQVTVSGVLRRFIRTEVTRSYSWLTLNPAIWGRFDRRPSIIADSVRTSSGAELIATSLSSSDTAAEAAADNTVAAGTVSDLASLVTSADTSTLVGRPVDLDKVTVQRIVSDRAFWVGATAPELFVVVDAATLRRVTSGDGRVLVGSKVSIDGEIKRLPGTQGQVTVTDWGVTSEVDAGMLKTQEVYVYASRLEMTR